MTYPTPAGFFSGGTSGQLAVQYDLLGNRTLKFWDQMINQAVHVPFGGSPFKVSSCRSNRRKLLVVSACAPNRLQPKGQPRALPIKSGVTS